MAGIVSLKQYFESIIINNVNYGQFIESCSGWSNPDPARGQIISINSSQTASVMTPKYPEFQIASPEAWAKAAAKSAPGGNVDALNWLTPDGITVKPLYTAADTQNLPYANTLPGF